MTVLDRVGLFVFSAVVLLTEAKHERFADEAQAWLIARDLPFWQMVLHAVRYEGAPPLWHALLWPLAHLGFPYGAAGMLSCGLAIASTWLVTAKSPLPQPIRLLVPFTFFLCFQYAVVARSYALIPLLAFTAAELARQPSRRIIAFACILALMGNANLQGLAIAAGFTAAFAWLIWKSRRDPARDSGVIRKAALGMGIVAGSALCALAVAAPPADFNFAPTATQALMHEALGAHTWSPSLRLAALLKNSGRAFAHDVLHSLSGNSWLSALFVSAVCWQLLSRRKPVLLLPTILLLAFLLLVFRSDWHLGMVFVCLVAGLWTAWPGRDVPWRRYSAAEAAASVALIAVCLSQIAWTVHAIRYDWSNAYSGSPACAAYLKAHAGGRKVFGYGYLTVAVSAYFDRLIFANQPDHAYWSWSRSNKVDLDLDRIGRESPDFIVTSGSIDVPSGAELTALGENPPSELRRQIAARGYIPGEVFCGALVMRGSFKERDCYHVYRSPRTTE